VEIWTKCVKTFTKSLKKLGKNDVQRGLI